MRFVYPRKLTVRVSVETIANFVRRMTLSREAKTIFHYSELVPTW